MPISNQKEEIDSRVLRLIGLDDVFDLDYETYLTLLKEAMVKGRMTKKTIPTEEVMLLTEEYKRVKSKKDSGRFEVKKKKITAGSFNVSGVKGLIGGSAVKATAIGASPLSKSLEDNISTITASMVSISETLKQQKKITDDSTAYDKRKSEQEKRGLVESKLEKRFEGLKKVAEKIIAPVKSLLDRIIQFFTTVILGRIVYKLVEWLGDEKNASKVKSIIRFVKDWWPALLGSYILFGTSFGKLIRGLTGIVGRFIFQLGKVAIPRLLSVIAKNPLASLIVGTSVAGTLARTSERERLKPELDKQRASVEKTEKDTSAPWYQKLGASFAKQELTTGQQRQSIVAPVPGAMFSGGGLANGYVSGEKGIDKVPAMLSDGEFVMSRGAVSKYGVDTLEAMNAAGGGTNKPKIMSGTTYAAGGGFIGSGNYGGGGIDSIKKFIKHMFGYDVDEPQTWGSSPSSSGGGGGLAGTIGRRIQYEFDKIFDGGGNQSSSNKPPSEDQGQRGGGIPGTIGRRLQYEYNKRFGGNKPSSNQQPPSNKPSGSPGPKTSEGFGNDKSNVFGGLGRQTYRDAAAVYLRSLMGVGGDLTEKDFGPESRKLLEQAIKRAESRQAQKINKAQTELAKDPNNPTKKSALKRLLAGQVRLEYGDYASKIQIDPKTGKYKPIYTEAEDDLKNILGQAWFQKQKDGGYRSTNEKYDFQKYQAPLAMLAGITAFENKDVKASGVNFQKRLEAIHQIASDPASIFGKSFADMVAPYKNTPTGRMLGLSGIAKDLNADVMIGGQRPKDNKLKNQKALETKRPWWDKMGWFGGSSRVMQQQARNAGSSGQYGRYSASSQQRRFTSPKPKPRLNPPSKPSVIYAYPQSKNKPSSIYNLPSTSRPPSFGASTKGSRTKADLIGVHR